MRGADDADIHLLFAVAATRRTPVVEKSQQLGLQIGDISPTSSRNMVPCSPVPGVRFAATPPAGEGSRRIANSSLSARFSGRAAQFQCENGACERVLAV